MFLTKEGFQAVPVAQPVVIVNVFNRCLPRSQSIDTLACPPFAACSRGFLLYSTSGLQVVVLCVCILLVGSVRHFLSGHSRDCCLVNTAASLLYSPTFNLTYGTRSCCFYVLSAPRQRPLAAFQFLTSWRFYWAQGVCFHQQPGLSLIPDLSPPILRHKNCLFTWSPSSSS